MQPGAPAYDERLQGPILFARYAYPPNERGFCGPDDSRQLLDYAAANVVDPGLVQLARGFTGPWPYLKVIAGAAGIDDPFDRRVVEAYWVGNALLDRVATADFGAVVLERFRRMTGSSWQHLAEAVPAGAVAHHSFHVFEVYPWVGLLEPYRGGHPLHILDRCRIRWGRVVSASGDEVVVESRPLLWDNNRLHLGESQPETARRSLDGVGMLGPLRPGTWVSLHWDWVCDRLSARQLADLQRYTARQLAITNRTNGHSGVAMTLG